MREDLRATADELYANRMITFDYNLSASQGLFAERMIIPVGGSFTFPGTIPQYTRIQDGITMIFTAWNEAPNGTGATYVPGTLSASINEHRTYYAQWTAIGGTGPGGGVIVYDDPSRTYGFRYLEMAALIPGPVAWSYAPISPYTSFDLGMGRSNTDAILAAMTTLEGAAVVCANFTQNGLDDWFLPSLNELTAANAFLGPSTYIWTSTMYGSDVLARTYEGDSTFGQTVSAAYVRPFRSF